MSEPHDPKSSRPPTAVRVQNILQAEKARQKNSLWVGYGLLIFLAFAVGMAGWWAGQNIFNRNQIKPPPGDKMLEIGDQRIDLQLPDTSGNLNRLSQWSGKPILLNFWASWCGPCVEEMPALEQIHQDHNKQIQIIGIALDDPTAVKKAIESMAITFPILIDTAQGFDSSNRFGNRVGAIPFSVLIDANGKLIDTHRGAMDLAEMRDWVSSLEQ